jgi:hypothetical protein
LAPLAGTFVSPAFGKAVLGQEGVALVLTLQASKAALRLDPWDGGTFSARLAPADRYTAVAANLTVERHVRAGYLAGLPDGPRSFPMMVRAVRSIV